MKNYYVGSLHLVLLLGILIQPLWCLIIHRHPRPLRIPQKLTNRAPEGSLSERVDAEDGDLAHVGALEAAVGH